MILLKTNELETRFFLLLLLLLLCVHQMKVYVV